MKEIHSLYDGVDNRKHLTVRRVAFILALYTIPCGMLFGAITLSDHFPTISVLCGFFAGVVCAACREALK